MSSTEEEEQSPHRPPAIPEVEQTKQRVQISKTFDRFLDVQQRELAIRSQELDLRRLEIETNERLARESIQAQSEDLKHDRVQGNTRLTRHYSFVAGLVLMVLLFGVAAIYLDAKDLVADALKYGMTAITAGAGGFFWGRHRGRVEQLDLDD